MSFNASFYMLDHRLISLAMVLLLAASGEIGYRLGCRGQDSQESFRSLMTGTGAAMLGLLGLLLGFSLSMAISRWDARHDVLINEANAIGTMYLRAGLLEDPLRSDLRDALREYTGTRIALSASRGDPAAQRAASGNSESLHVSIWSVVKRANQPGLSNAVMSSVINAANELIDIHESRLASIQNYLPAPLFLVLLTVASVAMGFLAWAFGAANQGGRTAIVMLGLLISLVLLLIMDVNRPQRGRINIGVESLERVLETMQTPSPQALLENKMTRTKRTKARLKQVSQPLCDEIRKHPVDHAAGIRIASDFAGKRSLFRHCPLVSIVSTNQWVSS